jgi:aminopeptidase N
MLRRLVGEAPFREALHDVQARHRFSKIGTSEMREAFERAAGRDLTAYFEAWVRDTRVPELRWNAFIDKDAGARRAFVSVRAQGLPGPVPLTVTLTTARGQEERSVLLPPEGARFTLEADDRIRNVELNEDEGLLAVVRKD